MMNLLMATEKIRGEDCSKRFHRTIAFYTEL